jgi:hypothetical protein
VTDKEYDYDVCLSFAGEQRDYVDSVANELKKRNVRVFYDIFEEAALWGVNLYEHLAEIYSKKAKYCIIFASHQYAEKVWTNHERRFAQERALKENEEYILPARFDDTNIPGLPSTVAYIDLSKKSPAQVAELFLLKLGRTSSGENSPTAPVVNSSIGQLSERARELVDNAKGADVDLFKSVGTAPSQERVYHSLIRARELETISERGCRVDFFGTGRYLRFKPRTGISDPMERKIEDGNTITITVEEINGTELKQLSWESTADAGDIALRIAEAAQATGCYPGDKSFDAGRLFGDLSVLLSVAHVESTAGRMYPAKQMIQLCLPQWAICETGLYRIDGPFYQIAAWRLNEDWWSHMLEKTWLDRDSLNEALVIAKALNESGMLQ